MLGVCVALVRVVVGWWGLPDLAAFLAPLLGLPSLEC